MFMRFFKPKITPGQVETLLVATNFMVNIGYQAMAFGKENRVKTNLVKPDSLSKARAVLSPQRVPQRTPQRTPQMTPQRSFR